jgi:hypothetical protein
MNEFKIKQDEMVRQAEKYRLVNSLEKSGPRPSRLVQKITKVLVQVMFL